MRASSLLLLVSLLGVSQAQTPSGFTPSVANQLTVMFNSTVVSPAGVQLSKAATQNQPTIGMSGVNITGTFIFVMLDLDVPSNSANGTRRTLLHAMNTGFKATSQRTANSVSILQTSDSGPANYIGPSPPVETPAFGHRYVQLLFAQPTSFAVPMTQSIAVSSRIGFDINTFMADAGLAAPLAANFFVVVGVQDALTSGTAVASMAATGSGEISKSTLAPFEGKAGRIERRGWWAGLLGFLAVALV